ncbi:MAG: hypothetical protein ACYCPN_00270 [Thermoplasmata archaeon]
MSGSILLYSPGMLPYALVAIPMVVVEVYLLTQLVPRSGPPPTLTRMLIAGSALIGSAGLLMACLYVILSPNYSTYTAVFWAFNFMMMAPLGFWVIGVILLRDRPMNPRNPFWPILVALLATTAEILMGVLFTVGASDLFALLPVMAGTLTTIWFLWSMVAAMVAMLFWIPLAPSVRRPLLGLTLSGVVAPWVVVAPVTGSILMTGAMFVTFGLLAYQAWSTPPSSGSGLGLSGWIVLSFLAMSVAGYLVALMPGPPVTLGFGLVMATVMTGEFAFILWDGYSRLQPLTETQGKPSWGLTPVAPYPRGGPVLPRPLPAEPSEAAASPPGVE